MVYGAFIWCHETLDHAISTARRIWRVTSSTHDRSFFCDRGLPIRGLWRRWLLGKGICCMLNPSTAGEKGKRPDRYQDPAKPLRLPTGWWSGTSLSLRSTDTTPYQAHQESELGSENDPHLRKAHPGLLTWSSVLGGMTATHCRQGRGCSGNGRASWEGATRSQVLNKDGQPAHPLYLARDPQAHTMGPG